MFVNRDAPFREDWRLAMEKEQNGPAFTAIIDDKVIGCAGIVIPWPGMGIAWVVLDKAIEHHGVWMTRVIKHVIRDAMSGLGLYRLEAVVLTDSVRNQRWIELLGFTRENGMAKNYMPDGHNVYRYELIRRR